MPKAPKIVLSPNVSGSVAVCGEFIMKEPISKSYQEVCCLAEYAEGSEKPERVQEAKSGTSRADRKGRRCPA